MATAINDDVFKYGFNDTYLGILYLLLISIVCFCDVHSTLSRMLPPSQRTDQDPALEQNG